MNYFTADTHFFHDKLLGVDDFAPRPFYDVTTMNQTIIDNWNARVSDNDIVYHLGDIALYFIRPEKKSHQAVFDVLKQLNGQIVFIKGNHDSKSLFKFLSKQNLMINGHPKFSFHEVGTIVKFDHCQYYLTHYPMMLGKVNQIINLHGHIHHYSVPAKENLNVGVDTPEQVYLKHPLPFGTPFSEDEIKTMVQGKFDDFKKRY